MYEAQISTEDPMSRDDYDKELRNVRLVYLLTGLVALAWLFWFTASFFYPQEWTAVQQLTALYSGIPMNPEWLAYAVIVTQGALIIWCCRRMDSLGSWQAQLIMPVAMIVCGCLLVGVPLALGWAINDLLSLASEA